MKYIHLVAFAEDGAIGKDNALLWKIPQELKMFKEITMGQSLLVGRATFESMAILRGRLVTVASRTNDLDYWIGKATQNALQLSQSQVFIIGGAEVYEATKDRADEVWHTLVWEKYPTADAHYPNEYLERNFQVYHTDNPVYCEESGLWYQFYKAKRIKGE